MYNHCTNFDIKFCINISIKTNYHGYNKTKLQTIINSKTYNYARFY